MVCLVELGFVLGQSGGGTWRLQGGKVQGHMIPYLLGERNFLPPILISSTDNSVRDIWERGSYAMP